MIGIWEKGWTGQPPSLCGPAPHQTGPRRHQLAQHTGAIPFTTRALGLPDCIVGTMTPLPLSEPPPRAGSDHAAAFHTHVRRPRVPLSVRHCNDEAKNAPSHLTLPFRAPLLRLLCSAAELRAPLLSPLRSPPSGALPWAAGVGHVCPVQPCHRLLPPPRGRHWQQPPWAFLRTSHHQRRFCTGVVFLFDSSDPSLHHSFDQPPANNSTRPPSPAQAPPRWVSSCTRPQIGLPTMSPTYSSHSPTASPLAMAGIGWSHRRLWPPPVPFGRWATNPGGRSIFVGPG
jgi:hypothetical protein